MAEIRQWEKEIDTLSVDRLQDIKDSLLTLGAWPFFRQEYFSDMGLGFIYYIIDKRIDTLKATQELERYTRSFLEKL